MSAPAAIEPRVAVQVLPLDSRAERILAVFDSLSSGETFEFLSSVPPRRMLGRLQAERKGLFEWSPLEQGPETWRIELFRRPCASGGERTVTEVLAWDHERLDALESLAMGARSAGDFDTARDDYSRFAFGLKRHIRFEEEVLFPRFEEETGLDPACGPTAIVRLEHREILLLLESIAAAIGDSGSAAASLRRRFHLVTREHDDKEEMIIYPGVDHLVGPAESDALVARFQAMEG